MGSERPLGRNRGGKGVGHIGEGDEEAVPFGAQLAPALSLERFPQEGAVLGKDRGIAVPQVLEEASGTLDIGEEQGNQALGERRGIGHQETLLGATTADAAG